jgi:hypothetical protein
MYWPALSPHVNHQTMPLPFLHWSSTPVVCHGLSSTGAPPLSSAMACVLHWSSTLVVCLVRHGMPAPVIELESE